MGIPSAVCAIWPEKELSTSPMVLSMNLEQKIGQLLIVGFTGQTATPSSQIIRDIQKYSIGGVILFDRFLAGKLPDNNIVSFNQTKELTRTLQDAAHDPLLIAVDQEGGRVNRFKKERGFPETQPAAILGNSSDTQQTTAAATRTASLLKELGFNLNLAPVVDLNSYLQNPIIGKYQRSFGSCPENVAQHAAAWVKAHRSYGVKTCLKHFPGHGSARDDSHLGFVDISSHWQREELTPYRKLIKNHLVDTVMTGHLYNSVVDSQYPATLSKKTVQGLLREELKYQGPVISDDMQMRAIADHYGLEEASCRAIEAGVDLLIFGNNLDYQPDITIRIIRAVTDAVKRGVLSEATIESAWKRVQLLKKTLGTL